MVDSGGGGRRTGNYSRIWSGLMCVPHITWTVYLYILEQYIFVLLLVLVYVHCSVSLMEQGMMM